jgi:hypothetical protein
MVETVNENHPRIVALLNARLIHELNKYYTHPNRSAVRYSLFSLYYGAYAQFLITREQPSLDLPLEDDQIPSSEDDFVLPKDDTRSYRRIIFDPHGLKSEDQSETGFLAV